MNYSALKYVVCYGLGHVDHVYEDPPFTKSADRKQRLDGNKPGSPESPEAEKGIRKTRLNTIPCDFISLPIGRYCRINQNTDEQTNK